VQNKISPYLPKEELLDLSKVTRLEVIDETGRAYSKWNITVEPLFQDEGRTLKLFITQGSLKSKQSIEGENK